MQHLPEEEGVVKYQAQHTDGTIRPFDGLRDLVAWRGELFSRGLIGNDAQGIGYGNISVRLFTSPRFLVSGTQTSGLEQVDQRHFAEVTVADLDRNAVKSMGRVPASSEALTHAALYQADVGIGGVAHIHSQDLWERHRNTLPTTDEKAEYGTPLMGYEMIRLHRRGANRRQGVIVMGGHHCGLIAYGPQISHAVQAILALADTP